MLVLLFVQQCGRLMCVREAEWREDRNLTLGASPYRTPPLSHPMRNIDEWGSAVGRVVQSHLVGKLPNVMKIRQRFGWFNPVEGTPTQWSALYEGSLLRVEVRAAAHTSVCQCATAAAPSTLGTARWDSTESRAHPKSAHTHIQKGTR